VDTKDLETFDPFHYNPVDVNGALFCTNFPVVHDQLFCLAHVEGEVVVLASHCQVSDLLLIGCFYVISEQAVVSSANLRMVLESCLARLSWVNRQYSRGLSTHP
jgi:hypothetical protein